MKDVCGDCGKQDPTWASINRGILLCQDCCGVHRSIGRHVSWVRSLKDKWWSPSRLKMVEALSKAGANSVWEYKALDQTSVSPGCKPSSSEDIRSNKEEFIRAKHEDLEYILRSDQDPDGPEGLGAQLHAAARAPDLLTTLRLLSLGADPNFYHDEKGSCPLHVAAKSNQLLQVELLLVYGADVDKRDGMGRTPEIVACEAGNSLLAERLKNIRFHAIDRLIQYLNSKKNLPGTAVNFSSGIHNLEQIINGVDSTDSCRERRDKLQSLTNGQFEKLVADIYDEIDRRQACESWQGPDPAPFLPTHPELSATRNQGRQKLGRLSYREFEAFVRDVLIDAKRRDCSSLQDGAKQAVITQQSPLFPHKLRSEVSDDEPLYDSVASDDDYASVTSVEPVAAPLPSLDEPRSSFDNKSVSLKADEEAEMRRSLASSAATIAKLQSEIQELQDKVIGLMKENRELKDEVNKDRGSLKLLEVNATESFPETKVRNTRPTSMYETRERLKNWNAKLGERHSGNQWPDHDMVTRKTEIVTKRIQELCFAMNNSNIESFPICASKIRLAIGDLTSLFPQHGAYDLIADLNAGISRLEIECAAFTNEPANAHEQTFQRLRHIAYDIAKATKILILRSQKFSSDQSR